MERNRKPPLLVRLAHSERMMIVHGSLIIHSWFTQRLLERREAQDNPDGTAIIDVTFPSGVRRCHTFLDWLASEEGQKA
jgi:hypothetical protein